MECRKCLVDNEQEIIADYLVARPDEIGGNILPTYIPVCTHHFKVWLRDTPPGEQFPYITLYAGVMQLAADYDIMSDM